MSAKVIFAGRKLLIATKHGKERQIAPVLEKELGVKPFVIPDLDTDVLGTFTGEIERKDDPLTTLRKKCRMGYEASGCDLVVASEGTFTTHPVSGFIPFHFELLMLCDFSNGLEVTVQETTTDTNISKEEIKNWEQLQNFAARTGFPRHALILRLPDDNRHLYKGITDTETLSKCYIALRAMREVVVAETDMRAMHNPKRMQVIARAAKELVKKIKSECPVCQWPGYGVTDARKGLPCAQCGAPTRTTFSYILRCARCSHSEEKLYPQGKTTEDPMYCDLCNP
ncbi:MAG: hypothetical protein NZM35_02180 [Chitinophagales bacterium]|nr:hypothetical protein [Chitinophagales bacterium]MDW8420151.1 hypothetical protein [Chitinophagales bacterium]